MKLGKQAFAEIIVIGAIFILALIITGVLKLIFPYLQGWFVFAGVLFLLFGIGGTLQVGWGSFVVGGAVSAVFFVLAYFVPKFGSVKSFFLSLFGLS